MIHTIRSVAVGDQESKIDSPIILYRGDREVEVEFTINGSKFTFTNGGNVIKSTNATHGQLVINTPTGENMFSEVTECHDGKVVFVITKEMIDELIEVGFYSFQIRLFDESQISRVTIPPVLKGIDIRNPIAAEDETNVVDIALVDYSVIVKDEFEDLSTFLPDGNYNKTEWESKDVISGAKLNKIEDALYNINYNMEATNLALLNRVENINKNVYGEIDKLGNELESEVEEFERSFNVNVERFKIDMNAAMTAHKNEVSGEFATKEEAFSSWRIEGCNKNYAEYPTSMIATQKMVIPGTHFNAIQGGCTDGKYLYCGVVNERNDKGNTTLHKIDIKNWEVIKTVTEFSLGHCNSMTYCDFDGYIHCIGLESYNDYKRVYRITRDLEYVDYYTIDISTYYPDSTGIGGIDYNPNTEIFTYLIRGDKKGYARYTKNKTFIDIVWTEKLSGTYAGVSTDSNFIYQSIYNSGNDNRVGIIDKEGNTLRNVSIAGMSGEIEETFIFKDKMIAVVNDITSYDDHLVYEIILSDFVLN